MLNFSFSVFEFLSFSCHYKDVKIKKISSNKLKGKKKRKKKNYIIMKNIDNINGVMATKLDKIQKIFDTTRFAKNSGSIAIERNTDASINVDIIITLTLPLSYFYFYFE